MIKPTLLASWKQSRFNTCGPASLMTALHELGKPGLSQHREMEIWKHVRHPFSLGSLPAYMAVYAAKQGVTVSLLHKDIAPPAMKVHWKKPRRSLHQHLLRAYYLTTKQEGSRGLNVDCYQDEKEILERMIANPGLRVIYLIMDDDGYLHYVLAREKAGSIAIMDPYYGRNSLFDQPDFLMKLGRAMMGYAILISH
ncbi:MAG: peptidase C39 family protein [Desulfatibacillum sp.]|nr:peptidase C39 family protein [Desulfatibacillum sp.]